MKKLVFIVFFFIGCTHEPKYVPQKWWEEDSILNDTDELYIPEWYGDPGCM